MILTLAVVLKMCNGHILVHNHRIVLKPPIEENLSKLIIKHYTVLKVEAFGYLFSENCMTMGPYILSQYTCITDRQTTSYDISQMYCNVWLNIENWNSVTGKLHISLVT